MPDTLRSKLLNAVGPHADRECGGGAHRLWYYDGGMCLCSRCMSHWMWEDDAWQEVDEVLVMEQ